MNVTILRHGQSTANAGEASDDPASIPLTELGREQAVMIAESWRMAPSLIVTSPFIRTKETAAPTMSRFPTVPHEEWFIQEFTYLSPEPFKGTTKADRHEFAFAFWERNDPNHREGLGAESLNDLFNRVWNMFERLEEVDTSVALFSHGMFMRAVLWGLLTNVWVMTPDTMQGFRSFCFSLPFPNAVSMPLIKDHGGWHVGMLGVGHIPKDKVTL